MAKGRDQREISLDQVESPPKKPPDEVDANRPKTPFWSKRVVATGMMDISLITANANQLRYIITYNPHTALHYTCMVLIIISLVLQVAVGAGLIIENNRPRRGRKASASALNVVIVLGVFLITVINVISAGLSVPDTTIVTAGVP